MSALSSLASEKRKRPRSRADAQSTEKQPTKKHSRRIKELIHLDVIADNPALLDMTDEPLHGEVESYSDYDSDSDEESINESINGGSARRLSIQETAEDENVDVDEAKLNTHVKFEAILQYLIAPPDLYQTEGGMAGDHGESTDSEIMREALALQTSNLSVNTKNQYKTHLRKFLKFCSNLPLGNINGDSGRAHIYDVSEVKVLRFFKEVMFKSTTKKYFSMNQSRDVRTPYMFKSTTTKDHILTLAQVLHDIKPDAKGRKVLSVPCGRQTMENALKALCYLQDRQSKRPIRPNEEPELRKSSLINNAIDKYSNDLVVGILVNHKDLSAECEIRNAYTVAQHIKCLLYTWAQPITILSPWAKEHLALAIRHSMILRNEDLCHLNLVDCFMIQVENRDRGSQSALALVCAMHRGKTNRSGHTQYGCALRHSDVRRCSIGAFAFYLFDRFHNKEEPPPDISDPDFKEIKVLQGTKGTHASRLAPLSYSASRETTLKTFETQELECVHLTHSGRHSGTIEAQKLGIRAEDIKLGGRWVRGNGRMDQHYMSNIPIRFAFGMAGFREGKPFHLKRNEVSPPVELQEMIFPFVETAFGEPGSEANKRWRQECLDEMNERDEDQPDQLQNVLPLDPSPSEPGSAPIHKAHADMSKKRFFKMVLRLRRVILQDAVAYMHTHSSAKSPLLEHSLFKSELFLKFKDDLAVVLDREDATLPPDLPPIMVEAITDQRQQYSGHYQALNDKFRQVQLQSQQQRTQEESFRLWMASQMQQMQQYLSSQLAQLSVQVQQSNACACRHPPNRPTPPFTCCAYGPYDYGEQVQQHTAFYQETSRVPWLGPTTTMPLLQPTSSGALIPPVAPIAAPIRPPAWVPPAWVPPPAQPQARPQAQPTLAPHRSESVADVSAQEVESEEPGFTVSKRPRNAREIWDERQSFAKFQEEYERRKGRRPKLAEKDRKALNNRLRIVEEIEFRAKQAQARDSSLSLDAAIEGAMKSLDGMRMSCNMLHKYCQEEALKRAEAV